AARRGEGYAGFIRTRVERLMRPTLAFVVAWSALALIVQLFTNEGQGFERATNVVAKPLWFLAVYMIAIGLAPAMLALHRRFRWWVPVVLVTAAAVVDVVNLGANVSWVGYLNFAFVWLFPHQLGYFYADGTMTRWSRRTCATVAAGGFGALLVLVNLGVYSPSMVGMHSERASNNDPPTVCLIALTVWLVGLALTFREPARRMLERRRVWTVVVGANSMIMTIFLWHLTALFCAVLTLYPLGWPQLEPGTTAWWLSRLVWIPLLAGFLTPFVLLFSRVERSGVGRRAETSRRPPTWLIVTAVGLLVGGLTGFALSGFEGLTRFGTGPFMGAPPPLLSALALILGIAITGAGARRDRP
ncbi:MAG: acyltransferase, partial [Actinomycetota bacterium]